MNTATVSNRRIHNVAQGSPEWEALREQYYTASEAPMAAGAHKNVKRNEAIRLRATGDKKEYGRWITEVLFARGHEYEAAARPMADDIIEDELFPVTMTAEVNGLRLLASLDGRTMDGRIVFEHKSWNEELVAQVRAGELTPHYTIQMDQQLIVSGAEKVLFMVSDGTPERCEWMWYMPPVNVIGLVRMWNQYENDVDAYQHTEEPVPIVGELVTDLPAVSVQVSGEIAIRSNFDAFRVVLTDFLDNQLIREPQTDQDFANLDLQVEALKNAEAALNAAEASIIAQVSSIDEQKRMKDALYKLTRDNRLMAERLVESKKQEVRGKILQRGKDALAQHIDGLIEAIGKPYMPQINADFSGAMRSKKTISSLNDAVDTELARAKIEADAVFLRIQVNLATLRATDKEYHGLFADVQQLVLKAPDDLAAIIKSRISEHKEAEERKIAAAKEQAAADERRKMEAEQAEKARAEERERIRAQAEADAKARADEQRTRDAELMKQAEARGAAQAVSAQVRTEEPAPYAVARQDEPATLKLGDIAHRLGFSLSAEFIEQTLGISPAGKQRAAVLYRESDWPRICDALTRHIGLVRGSRCAA